jgi:hypothetical protein
LQVADEVVDGQAEMGFVRRVKHARLPARCSSAAIEKLRPVHNT